MGNYREYRRFARTSVVGSAAVLLLLLVPTAVAGAPVQSKKTKPLPWPDKVTAKADCSGDRHALFGGFEVDTEVPIGTGVAAWVDASAPADKLVGQWSTTAHNDFAAEDGEVTSYAYCDTGKKPTVVKETKTMPGDEPEPVTVVANCPKKTKLVGGGFSSNGDTETIRNVLLISMIRGTGQSWQVSAVNEKDEAVKLTSVAVCRKQGGAKAELSKRSADVPGNTRRSATAGCPGSTDVAFMGIIGEIQNTHNALPVALVRVGNDKVKATAVHNSSDPDPPDGRITAIAYCR